MIQAKLLRDDGILVVIPQHELEESDFSRLQLLADSYTEDHGDLNGVLIEADEFPGWKDFASMLAHARFARSFPERVERVAAVTDNNFLSIMPTVADRFINAEVRHFPREERNKAMSWLRTGEASPS